MVREIAPMTMCQEGAEVKELHRGEDGRNRPHDNRVQIIRAKQNIDNRETK